MIKIEKMQKLENCKNWIFLIRYWVGQWCTCVNVWMWLNPLFQLFIDRCNGTTAAAAARCCRGGCGDIGDVHGECGEGVFMVLTKVDVIDDRGWWWSHVCLLLMLDVTTVWMISQVRETEQTSFFDESICGCFVSEEYRSFSTKKLLKWAEKRMVAIQQGWQGGKVILQ